MTTEQKKLGFRCTDCGKLHMWKGMVVNYCAECGQKFEERKTEYATAKIRAREENANVAPKEDAQMTNADALDAVRESEAKLDEAYAEIERLHLKLESLNSITVRRDYWTARIDTLAAQNAELLSALRTIVERHSPGHNYCSLCGGPDERSCEANGCELVAARAAIAKAEGK